MIYYTIYQITCTVNNKMYIGMHKTKDLNDGYMGSGSVLKKAIKKYGKDKFFKEILFIFDNEEEMINKEKELVNQNFCNLDTTYNMCIGGYGGAIRQGAILTLEQKQKISASVKKYFENEENILKHKENIKKRPPVSEQTKQKLKDIRNDLVWVSNLTQDKMIHNNELQYYLEQGWIQGRKTYIPKTKGTRKQKIKKTPEELKQIRRNAQLGLKRSKESIQKTVEKNSKEFLITTPNGEEVVIKNLVQYCKKTNLTASLMHQVLKGLQTHHKGYKIKRYDATSTSST